MRVNAEHVLDYWCIFQSELGELPYIHISYIDVLYTCIINYFKQLRFLMLQGSN